MGHVFARTVSLIPPASSGRCRISGWVKTLVEQRFLLLITVPFIAYVFVFAYLPLCGWILAFFDYKPGRALSPETFVSLKYFTALFKDSTFWLALRNTLVISLFGLVSGTVCTVSFAILINEMRKGVFKRFAQTASYLPHFVSWVVVAGIFISLLKLSGNLNGLLLDLGLIQKPYPFLLNGKLYWYLITLIGIWKETGWGAILYLSAMTGINMELYEAAYVDGAGRWKRIWHVTLPGIRTTIIILLVLNIGWLLGSGFEQNLLFGNAANFDQSEVLGSFIYRYGLKSREYSFGMAASVFQSLTGFFLVIAANTLSKRVNQTSVF